MRLVRDDDLRQAVQAGVFVIRDTSGKIPVAELRDGVLRYNPRAEKAERAKKVLEKLKKSQSELK